MTNTSPPFTPHPPAPPATGVAVLAPWLFVLLWSTGFIGSKLGIPYAEPFTFLALRFWLAAALLLFITLAFRASWPTSWRAVGHVVVAGVLIHGIYLSGVFIAISLGISAGIAALITGLQPILTAVVAGSFLGEKVGMRQWGGLVLGLIGVWLVVAEKIAPQAAAGTGDFPLGIAALFVSAIAISAGTLYQKKYVTHTGLRASTTIQFAAAAVVTTIPAFLLEKGTIEWSGQFLFAMGWLVVVLSLGAVSLLLFLIRRGAAVRVASLFYLTPPVTAVLGYLVFDERMSAVALAGFAVTVVAVALVVMEKKPA